MLFSKTIDWHERLDSIVRMTREMSLLTDPQAMVRAYGDVIADAVGLDGFCALSRRGLERPRVRVTRSHLWGEEHNPWLKADELPIFETGIFQQLIYGEQAVVIDDLRVERDDPAYPHLEGFGSLSAIPQFDGGVATNMIISLKRERGSFDRSIFPEMVWISNLFGRATQNLVLSQQLKKAYDQLDRELKVVGEIQRSLLPTPLPQIDGLELSAYYRTSTRAGGDYYDFFPLAGGRWGIFIADVSGHGTPAAVMMAMTHTMAHAYPGEPDPPGDLLTYLNRRLSTATTSGSFVTAFYGVYDPAARTITYASAGHNPPRLMKGGACSTQVLNGVSSLPLGIDADEVYEQATVDLATDDTILFYTDGITEVFDPAGQMFGTERLDRTFCQTGSADLDGMVREIVERVNAFSRTPTPVDDQTLLIARVK